MGNWDLMCLGCYCNDGYTPVGYSAYEKVFMGWVDYIKPEPNTYYTLPVWNQKNKETDKAVCVVSDINKNEYYIFENRRRTGWDRYLPGQGIMVTHIIYSANEWRNNKVNSGKIQLVSLLPADNKLSKYSESGDLWPNGSRRDVTDESTPATILYLDSYGNINDKGYRLGKPVTEMVINSDGTASFWYIKAQPKPTIEVPTGNINFGEITVNDSVTYTIKVTGQDLKEGIKVALIDPAGAFAVNTSVISLAEAAIGKPVVITFRPAVAQEFNATLTLSSKDADDVTVNLSGTAIASQTGHKPGDVNHDDSLDVADVTLLIKYILGNSIENCSICGDVDENGSIDITDVAIIIKMILASE